MEFFHNLNGLEIYAVLLVIFFLIGLVFIYKLHKRATSTRQPPVYKYDDYISKE